MSWWQYLLLAIVQGIAEILPISSSAHLQITRALIGIQEPSVAFVIALHFASALAVIAYYWKRLWQLALDFIRYPFTKNKEQLSGFRYVVLLLIATIPAGLAGLLLEDFIASLFASLVAVGLFLMVTGTLLLVSQSWKGEKTARELTWKDAVIVGLFQTIGLLPGISRSGITLIGTKARHIAPQDAAEFVFILFIPLALAAGLLGIPDLLDANLALEGLWIAIATVVSGLVTYLSLRSLLSIVRRGKVYVFGYYALSVGLIVAVLALFHVI